MGAVSIVDTRSTAVDNRQAITDNALGISAYGGSGNNTTANGNIFNLRNYGNTTNAGGTKSGAGAATSGASAAMGGVNLNILDGGAIDKSFDFAAFSLSEMLASIIEGGKQQQQTAQYTVDSIGNAIKQASTITQAGAAAAAAVDKEINGKNIELVKKGLIVGGLAFGAWWLFLRGKK